MRAREAELGRPARTDELEVVTWAAVRHAATVSGADYLAAIEVVHEAGRAMARLMQPFDVLVTATLAEPPARIGRFSPTRARSERPADFVDYRVGADGVLPYSPFTALANATGQPAMSVPLHWTPAGPAGASCRWACT